MSAYAPNIGDGPTQRHHQDHWQPAGSNYTPDESPPAQSQSSNGITDKVSGFFGADRREELPMYKDKPTRGGKGKYAYPGNLKKAPWFKQRRTVAVALTSLAAVSWWFGILSPLLWVTSGGASRSVPSMRGWEARAEQVRETFRVSFAGYEKNAWGYDEYHPVSKGRRNMTPNGMGWIIVDALDTMMLMNLTSELTHSRQWIHESLTYDQDHDVNTFETTIRMLGGLLSAHYLSTAFPGVYAPVEDGLTDDLYIEKATDLADRLLGAYETESGVPYASINLKTHKGIPSHMDGGASSTAEATSLQLEMKYLAKLTGEDMYWDTVENVMKIVDDNNPTDGLVPIFIQAETGAFRTDNIRLGSRGDSYYEYLIKQYLQTSRQEPVYQAMWNESLAGIKKHLITYSYPDNFTVLAERPQGIAQKMTPKMDHLVCFLPGTVALATTGGLPLAEARRQPNWGPQQDEDMNLAAELMNTCWGMYKATPLGLAGEITHFNLRPKELMYEDFTPEDRPHSPLNFDKILPGHDFAGRDDFIVRGGDAHNLQRPETVESLFYMWRITGEERYREWGWEMFQSFVRWSAVPDGTGFSSIASVMQNPPVLRDNMESFWLAETLKYFYLLFSPDNILPLTDVVFNTEAHPFPRFQLNKLFETGWQRKPRDQLGRIIPDSQPVKETAADKAKQDEPAKKMETVLVPPGGEKPKEPETPTVLEAPGEATPPTETMPVMDPVTGKEKQKVVGS